MQYLVSSLAFNQQYRFTDSLIVAVVVAAMAEWNTVLFRCVVIVSVFGHLLYRRPSLCALEYDAFIAGVQLALTSVVNSVHRFNKYIAMSYPLRFVFGGDKDTIESFMMASIVNLMLTSLQLQSAHLVLLYGVLTVVMCTEYYCHYTNFILCYVCYVTTDLMELGYDRSVTLITVVSVTVAFVSARLRAPIERPQVKRPIVVDDPIDDK
jgi:hypothetical protein